MAEYFGIQIEHAGLGHLRLLKNPRQVSPQADLINRVALWFQQVDEWRDRYLSGMNNPNDMIIGINENLIFLSSQLTEAM